MLLYGCGPGDRDGREETVGKEIADDYNRAMQKAQDVEVQLQDQKQRMDEALQEAEQAIEDQ
jgi:hypothetical protein